MAMKKSIGRTLAHIDVAATVPFIHEDFFNSHRDYHHLSRFEIGGKRISQIYPDSVSGAEKEFASVALGPYSVALCD